MINKKLTKKEIKDISKLTTKDLSLFLKVLILDKDFQIGKIVFKTKAQVHALIHFATPTFSRELIKKGINRKWLEARDNENWGNIKNDKYNKI